jgi:hypothetical protein
MRKHLFFRDEDKESSQDEWFENAQLCPSEAKTARIPASPPYGFLYHSPWLPYNNEVNLYSITEKKMLASMFNLLTDFVNSAINKFYDFCNQGGKSE